eukprot:12277220-Alexandrium_andersonii.AAC.1
MSEGDVTLYEGGTLPGSLRGSGRVSGWADRECLPLPTVLLAVLPVLLAMLMALSVSGAPAARAVQGTDAALMA